MPAHFLDLINRISNADVPEAEARDVLASIGNFDLDECEQDLVLGVIAFGMKNEVEAALRLLHASESGDIQVSAMAKAMMRGLGRRPLISDGARLRDVAYGKALELRIPAMLTCTSDFASAGAPEIAEALLGASYLAVLEWQCVNKRYGPVGGIWDLMTPTVNTLRLLRSSGISISGTTRRIAESIIAEGESNKALRTEVQELIASSEEGDSPVV